MIPPMAPLVAWVATLHNVGDPPEDLRLWSGMGDLTYGGNVFQGVTGASGAFAGISAVEQTLGSPVSRVEAILMVPPAAVREILSFDAGPVNVDIQFIFSADYGDTWNDAPVSVHGRLSNPRLDNGVYTVEIETWTGDADRGTPKLWSDDAQKTEYPGDKAFQFAAQLESGIEARWPP